MENQIHFLKTLLGRIRDNFFINTKKFFFSRVPNNCLAEVDRHFIQGKRASSSPVLKNGTEAKA
tara:strand:+ start:368 stop:559 length:192 start_codon:yes stop_codon:yes gene_type:complete